MKPNGFLMMALAMPGRRMDRGRCQSAGNVAVLMLALAALLAVTMDSLAAGTAKFRNDRILIKPKEGQPPSALAALHSQTGVQVLRSFPRMGGVQVLKLPPVLDATSLVALYQKSGLVKFAEPDYLIPALIFPNDFWFQDADQWNLYNTGIYGGTPRADIHAVEGWDICHSASNIIVAVIDTGVRYTHEDLAGNMWINPGESGLDAMGADKAANGVDDDGDGYVDDVHGIDAVLGTGDPNDVYGHGTHVSGTIGAVGNNYVGVCGVAWQVQIMACRFLDSSGNGSISDAATCIDYAISKGARIINASFGTDSFNSGTLMEAINAARDAGVLFVAAAGNSGNDNDAGPSVFPASYNYDNIISVGATDRNDAKAFFSNYGATSVHLFAPGAPVFSCWNSSDSSYQYFQGTSMAAPHVSGACALVWAHYPNLAYHQVIDRIVNGVDLLPGLAGTCISQGRLNLAKVLGDQPPVQYGPDTVWMDDAIPQGAVTYPDGDSWVSEPWNWVTNNPTPFSGAAAHQSALVSGLHEHHFEYASETLAVGPGDILYAYIYLDPVNPPSEIMLEWCDRCSEHRAFWGENLITWGNYGTSDRRDMGALPPTGQWVRLEVPASLLGLEGATLRGMRFMLVDGLATWDLAGRRAGP